MAQLADDEKQPQQQETACVEGEADVEITVLEKKIIIPNYGVISKQPPDVGEKEWFNCSIVLRYMAKFGIIRDFLNYRYGNLGLIIDGYNYNASINAKSITSYLSQYGMDFIWYGIVNDCVLVGDNKWEKRDSPKLVHSFWVSIFKLLKDRVDVKNAAIEKELLLYKFDEGGEGDTDLNVFEVNFPHGHFELIAEQEENKQNEVLLFILAHKHLFIFCLYLLFFLFL